jgi:copper chaperone NosL
MIISDERFAAARVTASGETLKFDDIGCLIQNEGGGLRADVTYWVRSYRDQAWLSAPEAVFIHARSLASPMGHDLAAFSTTLAAEELAAEARGEILRFHEIPAVVKDGQPAKSPDPSISR